MGISGLGQRGWSTLIDKVIGTPYEIVKYVAENMSAIGMVAEHLGGSGTCPGMMTKRSCKVSGKTGALGSTTAYALPTDVDPAKVISIQANVTAVDGARYFNDSRYFHVSIQAGKLSFNLRPDAPAGLVDATVEWFVIFEV